MLKKIEVEYPVTLPNALQESAKSFEKEAIKLGQRYSQQGNRIRIFFQFL